MSSVCEIQTLLLPYCSIAIWWASMTLLTRRTLLLQRTRFLQLRRLSSSLEDPLMAASETQTSEDVCNSLSLFDTALLGAGKNVTMHAVCASSCGISSRSIWSSSNSQRLGRQLATDTCVDSQRSLVSWN